LPVAGKRGQIPPISQAHHKGDAIRLDLIEIGGIVPANIQDKAK
jgi:hypothetical protein